MQFEYCGKNGSELCLFSPIVKRVEKVRVSGSMVAASNAQLDYGQR